MTPLGAADMDWLAALLQEAGTTEIMPRFRNLDEGAVRHKTSADDLVTEADVNAERMITEALLAGGHINFTLYNKLMPWDHLAGALITQEAGGHVRRFDGSAYRPEHLDGGLLATSDCANWTMVREALWRA